MSKFENRTGTQSEHLIKQISAGGHHNLVLSQDGKLFAFGFGQHGQLGLRSNLNFATPKLVKDLLSKPIAKVAAGWNHSLVLTKKGDIFACGYGQYGQLGLSEQKKV